MNREEAIKVIKSIIDIEQEYGGKDNIDALNMAIQALSSWEEYSDKLWKKAYERGKAEALSQELTEKAMTVDEMEREYEKSKALFHKIVECDDAISREMALKECHDIVVEGERYRVIQEETLLGLPPVTQKLGRWITEEIGEGRKVYCSECKESADFEYVRDGDIYSSYGHGVVKKTKYCPNCGAKMESEESNG